MLETAFESFESQKTRAIPKVLLNELHYSPEAIASVQNVFNYARDYSKKYFGHFSTGTEGVDFFREQPFVENTSIFEIILSGSVGKSIGVISVHFIPWIRQSYISLLLIDDRYRGKGIGSLAVLKAESLMAPESKYVSLKISCHEGDAINFWHQLGYVPESELPDSVTSTIAVIPGAIRLVKRTPVEADRTFSALEPFGRRMLPAALMGNQMKRD